MAGDGAADCVGLSGKGWLMESPSLARLNLRADAQVPKATLLLEHSLYVLDWWFVATPAVASSFARIHENFAGIRTSCVLEARRLCACARGRTFTGRITSPTSSERALQCASCPCCRLVTLAWLGS